MTRSHAHQRWRRVPRNVRSGQIKDGQDAIASVASSPLKMNAPGELGVSVHFLSAIGCRCHLRLPPFLMFVKATRPSLHHFWRRAHAVILPLNPPSPALCRGRKYTPHTQNHGRVVRLRGLFRPGLKPQQTARSRIREMPPPRRRTLQGLRQNLLGKSPQARCWNYR